MCFSATASFTAAGLLIVLGMISVCLIPFRAKESMGRMQKWALGTFAAMPLIFGLHQLSEGFVWVNPDSQVAIRLFAYTAYTFWPLYFCLSTVLIEYTRSREPLVSPHQWPQLSQRTRKRIMIFNLIVAFLLCVILMHCLIKTEPLQVVVETDSGRLDYPTCKSSIPVWRITLARVVYIYAGMTSLLVSSVRYSLAIAVGSLISALASWYLWEAEFESTWCYFEASLSALFILCVWSELQAYPDPAEPHIHTEEIKHIKEDNAVESGVCLAPPVRSRKGSSADLDRSSCAVPV